MSAENWDEIRTAYQVARLGTVSAAADKLSVHHATVIRHVDALEARLGVRLFQRHARGYRATEAGEELLKVAAITDDQFTEMIGRIRGRSNAVTGELTITTFASFGSVIAPALARFQVQHPDLKIRLLSDDRLFRLEYGEAHVAIRAGAKPQEPDNVVQLMARFSPVLSASHSYVAAHGLPNSIRDFAKHRFVGSDSNFSRAPSSIWLRNTVKPENVVFRVTEHNASEAAIRAGIGIGFVWGIGRAAESELVAVMESDPAWQTSLWLVTHVDLHRTPKVQAILKALKEEAEKWQG